MTRQDGCTCGVQRAPKDGAHLPGCRVVPFIRPSQPGEGTKALTVVLTLAPGIKSMDDLVRGLEALDAVGRAHGLLTLEFGEDP